MAVAILMSPAAPVVTSPKTISSATRAAHFHGQTSEQFVFAIGVIYLPPATTWSIQATGRAEDVTLWSGSVCGSSSSNKAWPAS